MHEHDTYEYAIIRVVPRVDREEFLNAGAIVLCPSRQFLAARVELDEERLTALDPGADVECVRKHLGTFLAVCNGGEEAGAIGQLSQRQRFEWLVSPRSTIIQTSRPHTGRCNDPEAVLERLIDKMVRNPNPR